MCLFFFFFPFQFGRFIFVAKFGKDRSVFLRRLAGFLLLLLLLKEFISWVGIEDVLIFLQFALQMELLFEEKGRAAPSYCYLYEHVLHWI